MRLHLQVFVSLLLMGTSIFAQKEAESDQLSRIEKELAEIKKIVKENGADDRDTFARFEFIAKGKIPAYSDVNCRNKLNDSIKIEKLIMSIKDGFIVEIQAVTKEGVFTNGNAPISVSTDRFSKNDLLIFNKTGKSIYVYSNEIFKYISYKPYTPDDINFEIDSKDSIQKLSKSVGINSVFDLRLFSDALGVFGGKSNGLAQTDVNFRQVIHSCNIFNSGWFMPMSYVKMNFNASKFDSKIGFSDSSTLNRSSLIQKNWLSFEISTNFTKVWFPKKTFNMLYLDIGAGINLSNIATPTDTVENLSFYYYPELGLDLQFGDNFGCNVSSRIIFNYNPQIEYGDFQKGKLFVRPSTTIYWNPKGNKANRIFGRVNYVIAPSEKQNSFMQLQFGYSVLFSSLMK